MRAMSLLFLMMFCTAVGPANAQTGSESTATNEKGAKQAYFVIKTNVLSLAARRPTLALERVFPNNMAIEISVVQGQLRNLFLTDFYQYRGVLLRVKKYTDDFGADELSPFWGGYFGTLWRDIHTEPRDGWLGGAVARDFTSNSLRAGGSLGLSYVTKSRITFEALGGLGYGRYLNLRKNTTDVEWKSYLDLQVWLSVGYRFGR